MTTIALAIAVVWAALFGAAYVTRVLLTRSLRVSAATVIVVYVLLSTAVLSWYGLNSVGLLGITGMLVPCLAAVAALYLLRPDRVGKGGRTSGPSN